MLARRGLGRGRDQQWDLCMIFVPSGINNHTRFALRGIIFGFPPGWQVLTRVPGTQVTDIIMTNLNFRKEPVCIHVQTKRFPIGCF